MAAIVPARPDMGWDGMEQLPGNTGTGMEQERHGRALHVAGTEPWDGIASEHGMESRAAWAAVAGSREGIAGSMGWQQGIERRDGWNGMAKALPWHGCPALPCSPLPCSPRWLGMMDMSMDGGCDVWGSPYLSTQHRVGPISRCGRRPPGLGRGSWRRREPVVLPSILCPARAQPGRCSCSCGAVRSAECGGAARSVQCGDGRRMTGGGIEGRGGWRDGPMPGGIEDR